MSLHSLERDKILAGLNPVQREAVCKLEGPLLILAGAGSGKTRVIVHRIAWLVADAGVSPYNIMAVTFTNKAAQEMRERVEAMIGPAAAGMWISTFHSSCSRILRQHGQRLGFSERFTIYADKEQTALLKEVARRLNLAPTMFPTEALRSAIDDAKNRGVDPEAFALEARQAANPRVRRIAEAYRLYQELLQENDALDFGDLLFHTVELFNRFPDLLEEYRERFHYILVDEYQDTNEIQYRLINLLAEPRRNLCVVGDDDQSIYSWRGAQIKNILDFEADYPEAKVIRLEENYRSTATILKAANQVIAANRKRKGKDLWTRKSGGEPISLYLAKDEADECRYVIRRISTSVREPGAFAIFYRTNTQSRIFEEGLSRKGIPYTIFGGTRFYDRAEVRDLLAYLKVVNNPRDGVSLQRILNVPARGVGKTSIERLTAYAQEHGLHLWEVLERLEDEALVRGGARRALLDLFSLLSQWRQEAEEIPPSELCRRIIAAVGYADWLKKHNDPVQAEARGANVDELLNAVELWENEQENPSLAAYLENVALVNDDRLADEEQSRVTLMTIHRAKGLEFDEVFLVGLEEGLFPGRRSYEKPELLEEERRLCYVGMTRAREKLHLSACRVRRLHGQLMDNRPSRFLMEIPLELLRREDRHHHASGSSPGSGRRSAPRGRKATLDVDSGVLRSGSSSPARTVTKKVGSGQKAPAGMPFPPGCRVEHAVFGPGVVAGVKGSGSQTKLDIVFRDRGRKTLLLKYASMKRTG
ncbi:MAG: UvrD-helicase domain-containing protein [Deltaproteobacteria bacterium]|nr:UvrD-helicase domain-containing protein [Deltaproteobacteria bacterium]